MKKLFFLIISFILLASCHNRGEGNLEFDKKIYESSYSSNFKIEGNDKGDDVLITVFNPWQGASGVSSQTIIQNNSKNKVPGFSGQIIKGEAKRIICMSSTHIAMLDALDALDRIVGVSAKSYISNPLIRNNPSIPDIGYEGHIDYETLIALQPDLVLLFSVNGSSAMEPRLKELGIPFIYIGDYLEESPLGKTEWIVPISEIIGKREEGIKIFEEVAGRYESLKKEIAQSDVSHPKVMVNAPFNDSWFMPSSESYVAMLLKDAGADYVYKKDTGNASLPIDMEEALKLVSESDFWLNIGVIRNYDELTASFPKFADAVCVKNGKVYNNVKKSFPGGGNDYFESGVLHPDLILKDLVYILHPELRPEKPELTYYLKLE